MAPSSSPARAQHAVWIPSMGRSLLFGYLRSYRAFSKENNIIHRFSCQTKRMFTWELLAALSDKGKVGQVV